MSVLFTSANQDYFSRVVVPIAKNVSRLTLMAWVKIYSYPPDPPNPRYNIVDLSTGSNVTITRLSITAENTTGVYTFGSFSRRTDIDPQDLWASTYAYTTGVWYHVAITAHYDLRTLDLYVNGVLQETSTTRSWSAGSTANTDVLQLTIGCDSDTTSEFFNGEIEDVRVYCDTLELTENIIKTIYNAKGRDGIITSLAARWPLHEHPPEYITTSDDVATDISINGFNLSAQSGLVYKPSHLGWRKYVP